MREGAPADEQPHTMQLVVPRKFYARMCMTFHYILLQECPEDVPMGELPRSMQLVVPHKFPCAMDA